LKRVICSTKEKGIKVFSVEEWIKDWQEGDILDDKHQYGKDLNFNDDIEDDLSNQFPPSS